MAEASRPCHSGCWFGFRRYFGLSHQCDESDEEEDQKGTTRRDGGYINYKDRHEAMAEVSLEGGEGDKVYFFKVRPGSAAEKAGIRAGDELLQVNFNDPKILFWRPAEEILPGIMGPVLLWWKPRPPEKEGERTRINSKKPKINWHDDEDEYVEVVSQYPKSRATSLPDAEWRCGSCDATNFDVQEYCRRCGLRDSRLPKRPGAPPRRNIDERKGAPKMMFGANVLTKEDVAGAADAGQIVTHPAGMKQASDVAAPRRKK
eukprot:TRINITY_DN114734_c0_g1_i1.p1 TRINITY_DN114734_c0_g1~~TRINITY_DN114734_c0_g1_i1.p1  ORF type:complete len:287 (-),score=62.09 TRINITY_DN114734_c0_g1_i1:80-859(-)